MQVKKQQVKSPLPLIIAIVGLLATLTIFLPGLNYYLSSSEHVMVSNLIVVFGGRITTDVQVMNSVYTLTWPMLVTYIVSLLISASAYLFGKNGRGVQIFHGIVYALIAIMFFLTKKMFLHFNYIGEFAESCIYLHAGPIAGGVLAIIASLLCFVDYTIKGTSR